MQHEGILVFQQLCLVAAGEGVLNLVGKILNTELTLEANLQHTLMHAC
jgi:hypothetical protein